MFSVLLEGLLVPCPWQDRRERASGWFQRVLFGKARRFSKAWRCAMSDSDGDTGPKEAPIGGAQKKDFIYKVKAFKRRTLHGLQKVYI